MARASDGLMAERCAVPERLQHGAQVAAVLVEGERRLSCLNALVQIGDGVRRFTRRIADRRIVARRHEYVAALRTEGDARGQQQNADPDSPQQSGHISEGYVCREKFASP